MKKYLFMLALGGLSVLTASAQDDRKLRNDHTYSTHNYKHPNKAAAARQWESKQGVEVRTPGLIKGPMTSYKHSMPGAAPSGGLVMSHTPATDITLRNYKIQRISLSRPATQPASAVADRVPSQVVPEGNP